MVTSPQVGCSFCHAPKDEVARLVAGPGGIYICERCVTNCIAKLASVPVSSGDSEVVNSETVIFCGFCGRTAREVALTGSGKHDVCSKCLVMSAEFVLEEVPLLPISRKWQ